MCDDRLITVGEAAKILSMSVRWVFQRLAEGAFSRIKPTGNKRGRTRLRLSEVQAYIQSLTKGTNAAL